MTEVHNTYIQYIQDSSKLMADKEDVILPMMGHSMLDHWFALQEPIKIYN